MVEMNKMDKKIYEYKNIKVKPATYNLLLRTQAAYQLEEGKRISMDGVVSMLLEILPSVNVTFNSPKNPSKKASKKDKTNINKKPTP